MKILCSIILTNIGFNSLTSDFYVNNHVLQQRRICEIGSWLSNNFEIDCMR